MRRVGGKYVYAGVDTTEKVPRGIELVARGIAGHGSVPLASNAIVHLAAAVAKLGAWRPEIRLNETTRAYFTRLAEIASPDVARHYRDVLSDDPQSAPRRRRLAVRARARALVDAAHLGVAEHLHRRLPLQRHPVRGESDARRPRASRRGRGSLPRPGRGHRRRPGDRGGVLRPGRRGRRAFRPSSTPSCSRR